MNGRIASAAALAAMSVAMATPALAQRATFQGIGQLRGGIQSTAVAISADGRVVVGNALASDFTQYAVRWTAEGLETIGPPGSGAQAASADGAFIVVHRASRAFRWSETGGMVDLGELPGGTGRTEASAISADGSVIVGAAQFLTPTGFRFHYWLAFRWTESGGMQTFLPHTHTSSPPWWGSGAAGVSADGTTITGYFHEYLGDELAYVWTAAGGTQWLPDTQLFPAAISGDGTTVVGTKSPGHVYYAFRWGAAGGLHFVGSSHAMANAVSGDGSVVVGLDDFHTSWGDAFVWDESVGFRRVRDVLVDEYGLDLAGWELRPAVGVSADGTVIVGNGVNPAGQEEGWVARLGNGPCYADCDASGEIDFFDFLCYQDSFTAAEPWADCDGSGQLDAFDFLCFQNAFAAGCQ